MYRGTPYLNRRIRQKEEERSMEYHLNNLTHIRPRTGTIEYTNDVQINKKKGEMQKEARFTEIQRENRILLQKISSIMGKPSRKTESQGKINKSLNSQFRKRQLQNIEIENAKLLKRLQDRKANYQTEKFKESWKRQKYVIKNLSNYPFVINDRKKKRSSVSQIGGGKSPRGANTIQLCRLRNIDGVSFLVTIRLNSQRLQIIGDTKDKKDIKVIQIDRGQAVQFIEQQCGGKIQRIFNCLRYDKVDEVLYLVANDVDVEQMKNEGNQAVIKIKGSQKKQQNFQYDINSQENRHRSEQLIGQIPIRISNGNKETVENIEQGGLGRKEQINKKGENQRIGDEKEKIQKQQEREKDLRAQIITQREPEKPNTEFFKNQFINEVNLEAEIKNQPVKQQREDFSHTHSKNIEKKEPSQIQVQEKGEEQHKELYQEGLLMQKNGSQNQQYDGQFIDDQGLKDQKGETNQHHQQYQADQEEGEGEDENYEEMLNEQVNNQSKQQGQLKGDVVQH